MGKLTVVRLGVTAAALKDAGEESCKAAAILTIKHLNDIPDVEQMGEGTDISGMELALEQDEECDKDCDCSECGECDMEEDEDDGGESTESDHTLSVFVLHKGKSGKGITEVLISTEDDEPWHRKDQEVNVEYDKISQWYEL